ncbi:MAG: hypothetical protein LRY71_16710 [Bacillaceae bacterium]|nr:hypothetical protein [Bacillaceae bacterium]
MNSRDKLRNVEFKKKLEDCLEDTFKNNVLLKRLQQERRQKALNDKINHSKPLAEALNNIIKQSPTLKNFLISGNLISNPSENGNDQGDTKGKGRKTNGDFQGKYFPTFFNLRMKNPGFLLKYVPQNSRARISFETDAVDGYFGRPDNPGETILTVNGEDVQTYSPNLVSGIATLNITLPEKCEVNQRLDYEIKVFDQSTPNGFTNKFTVIVDKAVTRPSIKKNKTNLAPPNFDGNQQTRVAHIQYGGIRSP